MKRLGHQVAIRHVRTRAQLDATLVALDLTLSPELLARLDAASDILLGVPHTIIQETAARVAGGKLEHMDVPVIPVASTWASASHISAIQCVLTFPIR